MRTVTPEQRLIGAVLSHEAALVSPVPTQPVERHLAMVLAVRDLARRGLHSAWLSPGLPVMPRTDPLPVVGWADVDGLPPDWRPDRADWERAAGALAASAAAWQTVNAAVLGRDVAAMAVAAHIWATQVQVAAVVSPVDIPMRNDLLCSRCRRRTVEARDFTCRRCGWDWHGL